MSYRPNILWFSLEDTSPRFGCYGDRVAQKHNVTPHLDALASHGRVYTQAFSTAPVCAPSRFSIITGQYAHAAGGLHMRTTHDNAIAPVPPVPYEAVPPVGVKCFTEYLRHAGYFCTNDHKTDYQFAPPRTAWDRCWPGAHWRDRPDPKQPFFAVINPTRTHESGQWADRGDPVTPPADVEVPPWLVDGPETRRAIARQYDNIGRSDAELGSLLAQLDEDGLADDTVVFVWSDHGEGLPRSKRWPLDSGTRIPLIVAAGANVRKNLPDLLGDGETSDDVQSLIDLAPTVLSLCGVERPAHLHGRPFIGPGARPREHAIATRDRYDEAYDKVRSLRDARYRYVRNDLPDQSRMLWIPYSFKHPAMGELLRARRDGSLTAAQDYLFAPTRPVEELYDTQAYPLETTNLAADPAHADALARLREALIAALREHGDLGEEPEAQMVERFWPGKSAGAAQPRTARPVVLPMAEDWPLGRPFVPQPPVDLELRLAEPAELMLHCPTQGASIAYTFEAGPADAVAWQVYGGPVPLPTGPGRLRVRAHRIGHRESEEVAVAFQVTAADPPR